MSVLNCIKLNLIYNSGIYIDELVDNFDSPVKHYDQVKNAVTVLRESLAAAEVDN